MFPLGPSFWGNIRDAPFLRPLRKGSISLFREIFMSNLRDKLKKKPCKRAALSIVALLGDWGGVRLLGLEGKRK
jgi:hypothetical protein